MPDLTPEQIAEIRTLRMTTDIDDVELSERFGVTAGVIKQHTTGITRTVMGVPDDGEPDVDAATEKTERQLHKELLDALKVEGIGATEIARGLKKMLDSADMQDVREAVKEVNRIMGVYSKEKAVSMGGTKVYDKQYELKLPKRKEG